MSGILGVAVAVGCVAALVARERCVMGRQLYGSLLRDLGRDMSAFHALKEDTPAFISKDAARRTLRSVKLLIGPQINAAAVQARRYGLSTPGYVHRNVTIHKQALAALTKDMTLQMRFDPWMMSTAGRTIPTFALSLYWEAHGKQTRAGRLSSLTAELSGCRFPRYKPAAKVHERMARRVEGSAQDQRALLSALHRMAAGQLWLQESLKLDSFAHLSRSADLLALSAASMLDQGDSPVGIAAQSMAEEVSGLSDARDRAGGSAERISDLADAPAWTRRGVYPPPVY